MKPLRCLTFLTALAFAATAQAHTLIAFGDSVTAPRGSIGIYAERLASDLWFDGKPVEVINAGVGGDTSTMARKRFETDVLHKQPDMVVLMLGINDSMIDAWKKPPATQPRVPLADYRANLASMVMSLQARGTRVVLMTPSPLAWTDTTCRLCAQPPYLPDEPEGLNVVLREYAQAVRGSCTYLFLLEPTPGELWVGSMDAHAGWGATPRARHVKVTEQVLLEAAEISRAKRP